MNDIQLREIIIEQNDHFSNSQTDTVERDIIRQIDKFKKLPHAVVITGIRRSGKSTLLKQIANKYYENNYYYLSFEDERLLNFTAEDFNRLYELFIELFGNRKVFFFDEIQNADKWESFVRRMIDRDVKFYLTGSNAMLLSRELGTKLTGRYMSVELYPFSFKEYLLYKKIESGHKSLIQTEKRALIKKHFNDYKESGGMPEYLKYGEIDILRKTYDDILFRDIAVRYSISEVKILRELALYLFSNISRPVSFNKLKQYFNLGSVNTIKKYIGYLEDSYLLFTVNRYSHSVKQQLIAPKKIYSIDTGLCGSVSFHFSKNEGQYLENMVFLFLKRKGFEIFYYLTGNGKEVDFLIREGRSLKLVQVSMDISSTETRDREISSLVTACGELNLKEGLLLTDNDEDAIKIDKIKIKIMPVYKWMLEDNQ